MPPIPRLLSKPLVAVVASAIALALIAVLLDALATSLVGSRLRALARSRHAAAAWRRLDVNLLGTVTLEGLTVATATDTLLATERLRVAVRPTSWLRLAPRLGALELRHARIAAPARRPSAADSLDDRNAGTPRERERNARRRAGGERVQTLAANIARILLLPARHMPRVTLRDVSLRGAASPGEGSADDDPDRLTLSRLDLDPRRDGIRLFAQGVLDLSGPVSFDAALTYGRDDRLAGGVRFEMPGVRRGAPEALRLSVDGHVVQDRGAGVLTLADDTRVTIGELPLRVSGSVERRGPRIRFALAADSVTAGRIHRSLPAAILGPLRELAVRGAFDYRLGFDLDVSRPDSVEFAADVIPLGLALGPSGAPFNLYGLEQPFTATIRLPRGHIVVRELSEANPNFRTLDQIDSTITHALVTNEDGGFFRHRGFNIEAVKASIAENLKAGAYRRGAGTITMQLARNLYLGHDRTLSRKAQEVVLAWVLEHLTGVSKRRLLEIYLNIIEWGPGVHGANEAARYYFDKDARDVTVAEALFMATVVPSPRKWHYRFDDAGALRPFARAQMHFIGRAMIAKGWLAPEDLPVAEALNVSLRGPARAVLFSATPTDPPLPEAAAEAPR